MPRGYRWFQPYAARLLLAPWYTHTISVAWCLVVLFLERGAFYWASSRCDVAPSAKVCRVSLQESSFRVLVLSDPQIVEKGTYGPISPIWQSLISHFSNEYLRKAWLALSKQGLGAWLWPAPKPADLVVFLGDMTDRGRWYQSFDFWSQSQANWLALFPGITVLRSTDQPLSRRSRQDLYPALVLPGNHDIGLPQPETGMPSSKNELAAGWFQHQYAPHVDDQFVLSDVQGNLSWDARIPISINGSESVSHELVVVNGPALVGMEALDEAPWASEQALTNAKAHAASTSQMIDWLGTHTNPEGVFL